MKNTSFLYLITQIATYKPPQYHRNQITGTLDSKIFFINTPILIKRYIILDWSEKHSFNIFNNPNRITYKPPQYHRTQISKDKTLMQRLTRKIFLYLAIEPFVQTDTSKLPQNSGNESLDYHSISRSLTPIIVPTETILDQSSQLANRSVLDLWILSGWFFQIASTRGTREEGGSHRGG